MPAQIRLSFKRAFLISCLLLYVILNTLRTPLYSQSAKLMVENIEISGNSKTSRQVILDFFDFKIGDQIEKQQLDIGIQRLKDSHFFKKTNVYTQPGTNRGQIIIFIEIEERRWPYFQFKGGYNELDGWYLSPIGLRFDNILGRGNYMGIEFYIGDRLTGLDVSFLRKNIFASTLNLKALFFTRTRQFVHYLDDQKYLQLVGNSGLGFRINGNSGVMKYLWFDFIIESHDAQDDMWVAGNKDDRREVPLILVPYVGESQGGRFVTSLNLDTRDQPFFPTRGIWGSFSFEQVSSNLQIAEQYYKWILDARGYQEITRKWTINLRAKAGWISNFAPFYDKFYLGGPNSLRGYEDRSLNPLGYASRLVQGSAELRFPFTMGNFPRHFLSGVVFYDIGQAWNEPDTFNEDNFKSSVGYGFRFALPFIGLVRLDFAYPIPDYEVRIHLSLGHTF